jgi:hypothetical protein
MSYPSPEDLEAEADRLIAESLTGDDELDLILEEENAVAYDVLRDGELHDENACGLCRGCLADEPCEAPPEVY